MKYTVRMDGAELEPMTVDQLERVSREGVFDSTAEYYSDRHLEWRPIVGLMCDESTGARLKDLRKSGFEKVRFLGSGTDEDCPVCSAMDDAVYAIDAAAELPPKGCSCVPWCRGLYVAETVAKDAPKPMVPKKFTEEPDLTKRPKGLAKKAGESKEDTDAQQIANGCIGFFLVGAVFFIWLMLGSPGCSGSGSGSDGRPATPRDESSMAWVMSQSFLEEHLKAPSSAKYPWGYSDYVTRSNGYYVVNAYVDAQNGFGAMLRLPFTAKLKHVGGEQWRCEYLELDGKVLIASGP